MTNEPGPDGMPEEPHYIAQRSAVGAAWLIIYDATIIAQVYGRNDAVGRMITCPKTCARMIANALNAYQPLREAARDALNTLEALNADADRDEPPWPIIAKLRAALMPAGLREP